MRPLFVMVLLFAAACDGSAKSPPTDRPERTGSAAAGAGSAAAGSGSAGSADPWHTESKPKPPDTAETRQKRAEAALGRVATIKPIVEKLRGLTFKSDVPTQYQTTADFQAFVRREIAKELPPKRSSDLSAALAHLGFLVKPLDLATTLEHAMTTQAGAYYDPAVKSFFLVLVPDNEAMLDTISAHELSHGLQDQHFDLSRYLPSDQRLDDDAATARRFIVEGDATFVMMLYGMHTLVGDKITPAMVTRMRAQIAQMAGLDADALRAQLRTQAAMMGLLDPEIQKAIDAMDSIPATILVPLVDSYMKGAMVALTAYEQGGWAAVNDFYRMPPTSTEQVLHPETKLFPVHEMPRRVILAKLKDPELANNVLGELQWKIYFQQWKAADPVEAAAGWGGDRYSVTRGKDGQLLGRIATTWDTEEHAQQFAEAYVASLAVRFPEADIRTPHDGVARPDGSKLFVRRADKRVFIVDGARDPRAIEALIRTTKF
jgi:hypothetical protein